MKNSHVNGFGKRLGAFGLLGFACLCGNLYADPAESCSGNEVVNSLLLTQWESGLGDWIADSREILKPSTFDTENWASVGGLPDGRPGNAAFVANLNTGNCAEDDESGVLMLDSPPVAIPEGVTTPRIAIDHWFQIENDWDGGNIKISVNGGDFVIIPTSAFETGAYTGTLFEPFDQFGVIYNTNPLAGEEAFTGTPDGGETGSWIESRINLSGIATGGDTIILRLDFGVDGCDGDLGWYVDDVEIYSCRVPSPPSLTLVKQVVNDNGGTAQPSDWTLTATGPSTFGGNGPEVSSGSGLEPGTYDLSESGGPGGYQAGNWQCAGDGQYNANSITLEFDQQATCTVINDDIEPALTLVKQVINDDGGTASASDWFLTAAGPAGFSGSGPIVSNGANFQAGNYTLSESGGPAGYFASDWSCDGGSQQTGKIISLAVGESATCTITNNDLDSDFLINSGQAGAWFNPETAGQGVLIDVEDTSNFMFIAWFTYTDDESANPLEQRWLTAQGNYQGNRAELVLYETLGGKFDDPQPPETLPVGEVTIVFNDCTQGIMTYRVDSEGLEGEFPLTRVIPGSENTCTGQQASIQAVDINAGMDGAWFDVETPGQGFLIDSYPNEGGDFIFVAWFTYGDDTASGQRWLTAQGGFEASVAEIDVYETTGGSFDDPTPPSTVAIGTMSMEFDDCNNATLIYDLPDEQAMGEIAITRVVPGTEALCNELNGNE